ncbi:MAG: hypothetical protein L0241_04180 [Planctomycetia bacterium]|nr:hypothetical protein [Planctomycetia bacterium]
MLNDFVRVTSEAAHTAVRRYFLPLVILYRRLIPKRIHLSFTSAPILSVGGDKPMIQAGEQGVPVTGPSR